MQFIFCLSVIVPLLASAAPAPAPEPLYANGRSYADIGPLRDDCGREIGRLYRPDCRGTRLIDDRSCCPRGTTYVDLGDRRGCANYYDRDCGCDDDCDCDDRVTTLRTGYGNTLIGDPFRSSYVVGNSRNVDSDAFFSDRRLDTAVSAVSPYDLDSRAATNFIRDRRFDTTIAAVSDPRYARAAGVRDADYIVSGTGRSNVDNIPDVEVTDATGRTRDFVNRGRDGAVLIGIDDVPNRRTVPVRDVITTQDRDDVLLDLGNRRRIRDRVSLVDLDDDARDGVRLLTNRNSGNFRVVDLNRDADDIQTVILASGYGTGYTTTTYTSTGTTTSSPYPTVTVVNVPAYNVCPTPVPTYVEPAYVRIPTHTVVNVPVPGFTPVDYAYDNHRANRNYRGRFAYEPRAHTRDDYLTINPGPTQTYINRPCPTYVEPCPPYCSQPCCASPCSPSSAIVASPCPSNCNQPCCYNPPCSTTLVERPCVSVGPCPPGCFSPCCKKEVAEKKKSVVKEIVNPNTNTSAEAIKDNMKVKARNKNKEAEEESA